MDDIFQNGLSASAQDNLDSVLPPMRGVAGLLKVCDQARQQLDACAKSAAL
jgi:hypothetical protein